MSKVWFITGANRGFGRQFAEAALARGDRVAATSRKASALVEMVSKYGDLVFPLELDVTDRAGVERAVKAAADHFDRLDVIVNNAGYGLFGMIEEITVQQMRDQMEVNFFGLLNVTQAVLPILRKQGSGHIIQMSTIGGVMAFTNLGAYNASKWAVEGLSEALAQEVGQFGINVTLIEPGLFDTDWRGSSAVHADPLPHYESLREAAKNRAADPSMIGDPKAAGQAILTIVDAEKPPLRVFFGKRPVEAVPAAYEARLKVWDEWKHVSLAANGH